MLPVAILTGVLAVCATVIYVTRPSRTPTSSSSVDGGLLQVMVEAVIRQSDTQLALLEKMAVGERPPAPDAPGVAGQASTAPVEVDWDPTDADRFLSSEFGPMVPQMFANDAPAPVSHPLGIPGLPDPFATNRRFAPNVEFDA